MPHTSNNLDKLRALCILESGERTDTILNYLGARGVDLTLLNSIPAIGEIVLEREWHLILVDADLDGADIIPFLKHCKEGAHFTPVIAFHNGSRGSRDAALIRMGAYDALPKDIDRWNTEVYLDRAIAQAHQARQLLALSRTDHVTGLFNQRFLYENLKREIRRTSRTSKDLTVALLDLDNFKGFNDTYGHIQGDKALGLIGSIIQASIREGIDSAYRYGGDEFMLILPETGPDQAVRTVHRILGNLAEGAIGELTFSVGVALLSSCDSVEELIRCADDAMYQAKNSGGDRVMQVVCGQ